MSGNDLPPEIVNYLARQANARDQRAEKYLAALTPRERSLIHDAAVMGYVQGVGQERHKPVPKDSVIMHQVVQECQAFPEKFSVIGGRIDSYAYPDPEPEPGTENGPEPGP